MSKTNPLHCPKTLQAILMGLSAFLFYALFDVCTKTVGKASVPFVQMLVLFGASISLFLFIASFFRGGPKILKPTNLKLQSAMTATAFVTAFVNVATFTLLPLTTVYTALFTSPLISAILAALFLKEKITRKQAVCIVIGFCGAVFAVNPFQADLHGASALGWMLLPLYPLLFSIYTLFSRELRKTTGPDSIAFMPTFVRTLILLPFVLYDWHPMQTQHILIILVAGALGGIGNLLFNGALARAKSAVIAPLHYSQLIYGAVFGYLLWADIPAWYTYVGAVVIVASGLVGARVASRQATIETAAATA